MGNQLRALEAALAVGRVLRRMLVVPDYMADNGEGESYLNVQAGRYHLWPPANVYFGP